ncbi:hypothetical protein INT45_010513 [Circinella minor]|uniref:NAD+ kinase n=1 Tax=Circinella minor TaxID=1195481 RepID=A0A8H7S7X6_9FUNG|nr:hypothetical protein INT45_010513 [Circinella minor]
MEETDIHDALDVNSTATLAVTANQVKAELRRASANIPNHNDNIPNVVNYLSQKRIKWKHSHDKIMIVTKAKDYQLLRYTRGLAQWLITKSRFGKRYPFTVYVDGHLKDEKSFKYQELCEKNSIFKEKLQFWTPKLCHENPSMFHLIITLGGDGTVLFTSWLFQTIVPPVMSFHLGSLNFLAPFPYDHHKEELNDLFEGENGFRTTVRMRLSCTVYRVACQEEEKIQDMLLNEEKVAQHKKKHHPHEKMTSSVMLETAWMKKQLLQSGSNQEGLSKEERQYLKKAVPCYTTIPCETYEVLNELVVDRGPSSYMSMLELFGDERHLTTVQADGLVIATPTGSTAYSLSAHGSLTHPDIRATLVTPICPHTLSFRPMLLPETMSIRVVVPFGSSKSAYCSFDGRNRVELRSGDHVKITMSPYPFPTVCRTESSDDWFSSLQSSLQWNVRQRQSYVILESDKESKETDEKEKVSGTDNMLACLKEEHEDDNKSAAYDAQKDNDDGEIYTLTDEEDNDIDSEENHYQGIPMWGSDELKL